MVADKENTQTEIHTTKHNKENQNPKQKHTFQNGSTRWKPESQNKK